MIRTETAVLKVTISMNSRTTESSALSLKAFLGSSRLIKVFSYGRYDFLCYLFSENTSLYFLS